MGFAKWAFRIAGIYGLVTVAPMYLLEAAIARSTPPAITHPEYFYGWVSMTVVFQLVFLTISSDPARYRPVMILAVLEKVTWLIPLWWLAALGRVGGPPVYIGSIDALWATLFVISWFLTSPRGRGEEIKDSPTPA